MKDVLARLRKYEIRIRKAVNSQMRGNYHSVFKGSGLEFDDVRTYQYGDDVRTIDWNVSAKGHGTFVKIFREEKEQTVFCLVDVSASQEIGRRNSTKMDVARDICGVLTLSAVKEDSQVGLICFSDQKEKYMKPAKGLKHGYEVILNLFQLVPRSAGTSLSKAVAFTLNILKRRSVVIFVSDFIDDGYEADLRALARRHDLVVITCSTGRRPTRRSWASFPCTTRKAAAPCGSTPRRRTSGRRGSTISWEKKASLRSFAARTGPTTWLSAPTKILYRRWSACSRYGT
jgi:uncharacterized protein (DUF58 family)